LNSELNLQKLDTKKLALASILGAVAALSEIITGPPFDIPFPLLPGIVSWDLTGIPILISLLFNGSLGGVYTSIIGCSIIFIRGNVAGGIFKLIAELASILAFAATRKGIIMKTVTSITSRVLIMTLTNFFLLPIFYPLFYPSHASIIGILFPLALFNLTQGLLNIVPAYIIYSKLPDRWRFWTTTKTNI
jgi:hypothetical protein